MRHYPADSPEAMARIIAHTLMVDGAVDSSELKLLAHRDVIARIGLEDEAFDKVFYQYCEDLLSSAQRMQNGKLELDANTVEHLLAEIQHPALQEVLVSSGNWTSLRFPAGMAANFLPGRGRRIEPMRRTG